MCYTLTFSICFYNIKIFFCFFNENFKFRDFFNQLKFCGKSHNLTLILKILLLYAIDICNNIFTIQKSHHSRFNSTFELNGKSARLKY